MARNPKALRTIALFTAIGGASALLVAMGSAPASAAEERLHNESFATYGLVPPSAIGSSKSFTDSGHNDSATQPATTFAGAGPSLKGKGKGDEPGIEDPPLPGYDGNGSTEGARATR